MKITTSDFLLTILGFFHFKCATGLIELEEMGFYVEMADRSTHEGRMARLQQAFTIPDWMGTGNRGNLGEHVFIYKEPEENLGYLNCLFNVRLNDVGRRPRFPSVPGVSAGPTFAEMRFGEGHLRQHYSAGPFSPYVPPPLPRSFYTHRTLVIPPVDHVYIKWGGIIYSAPLRPDEQSDSASRATDFVRSHVSPDRDEDAAVHDTRIHPR